MQGIGIKDTQRPDPDQVLVDIAEYVLNYEITSKEAYETAKHSFIDAIGCGLLSLDYPACTKLLGPVVPGATMQNGARVIGTSYELDPVMAAFNNGCLIRWLDYNDTWLAAEWGHPSDNLGGILAVADYLSRQNVASNQKPLVIKDVLTAMIKAHEIQGIIALENSFNRVGIDHVILVRIATTAVVAQMIGCTRDEIINALSMAWIDGGALRTYRHAPNTGSRKSWAAGDATSRGVRLAYIAKTGEMGYPSALSAKNWGFYDVLFKSKSFSFSQAYGSYVMENVLFKIAYPAEFHAQTAVECALKLHPQIKDKLNDIDKIVIQTQEAAVRIIDKTGPLANPADRDHCLQYMIAIPLIYGRLLASDYEDNISTNPLVDELRAKMQVKENKIYSEDYMDANKRYIGNSIQIFFKDGSHSESIEVHYPIGHRKRRDEGIPFLKEKFEKNLRGHISEKKVNKILAITNDQATLEKTTVHEFMDLFVV